MAPTSRKRRLTVLAVMVWGCALGTPAAQAVDQPLAPSTLATVKARVPTGDVVYVTDTTGVTLKGTLATVADDAVEVKVGTSVRRVAVGDVRQIQWQRSDSPLNGVLIGATIGAFPGVYWLVADPNECTGMCPEEYAYIGIGAVVGGLIDHAIKRKVTVYEAGATGGRAKHMAIGPLLKRDRKGVQVAVRF